MNTSAKAGDYHPKMGVRDRFLTGLARQLGRPDGMRGRVVARHLNRGNRSTVTAAVDATGVGSGQTAADIGFGGGVGLPLLLVRVLPGGHVHGVDLSDTMLDRAKRRYRKETLAGSLTLHAGSITALHPADVMALPFLDDSFDVVAAMWRLYHVPDLHEGLAEIRRVLRPSGALVATTNGDKHLAELLTEAGGAPLITQFSTENGSAALHRHFDHVSQTELATQAVFCDHAQASAYLATFDDTLAASLPPFEGPREYAGATSVADPLRPPLRVRGTRHARVSSSLSCT